MALLGIEVTNIILKISIVYTILFLVKVCDYLEEKQVIYLVLSGQEKILVWIKRSAPSIQELLY